jgi:hypothetical protein
MKSTLSLAALSLAISNVSAHYIFQQLSVGSTKYPVFQYIRQNSNYNSPVTDLTSNDLRCNVGASGANTQTVSVAAGSQLTFTLDTPVYHQGPISVYAALPAQSSLLTKLTLPQLHVQSPDHRLGLRRVRRLVQD